MVIIKRKELKKTKVYDTYWKFANERQNIFIRKFEGEENNLTEDKILQEYKFTNAYRASDRVSQYLIRNIIYQNGYSEEDIIFRILLFKTFNNIDTWKKLENILGLYEVHVMVEDGGEFDLSDTEKEIKIAVILGNK